MRALLEHGASALQRSGGGELPEEIARRSEEIARRSGETSAATVGALCSVLGAAAEAESLVRQKALLAELEGEGAPREGGAAARGARSGRKKKAKKKKERRKTYVTKFKVKRCTQRGLECTFMKKAGGYWECKDCKRRPEH